MIFSGMKKSSAIILFTILKIVFLNEYKTICLDESRNSKSKYITEVEKDILTIYDNPKGSPDNLLQLAKTYLHTMQDLKISILEKRQEATNYAISLFEKYAYEGSKHSHLIPYGNFIKVFGWNMSDIKAYHSIITSTRRVWKEILKAIGAEISEELSM
uniref:Uncharacterized protein n=1 Tax=Clastoptera arizonana TaxID=38151 RepID=A0A1B6EGN4_9HEMI